MSKDEELHELEQKWERRLERFTAPEPTREQTFMLLDSIKAAVEDRPRDIRTELEGLQKARTPMQRMFDLLASQWTFYGMRSGMLTTIGMLILTISVFGNDPSGTDFSIWLKGLSFLMIVLIAYVFRPKNEGNEILETLSYYPFIQQMFARFIIVMSMQLVLTFPFIFFLFGSSSTMVYIFGTLTPLLFFGTFGFVSTFWLGGKVGTMITTFLWFVQMLLDARVKSLSLFRLPESDWFMLANIFLILLSILLLSSMMLRREKVAS